MISSHTKVISFKTTNNDKEVWNDWIKQNNEYAINDKKAIDENADKYMCFINVILKKQQMQYEQALFLTCVNTTTKITKHILAKKGILIITFYLIYLKVKLINLKRKSNLVTRKKTRILLAAAHIATRQGLGHAKAVRKVNVKEQQDKG